MSSSGLPGGRDKLNPMIAVLIRVRQRDIRQTEQEDVWRNTGRRPCEDGDRDRGYAATHQGTSGDTNSYQKQEEARNGPHPHPPSPGDSRRSTALPVHRFQTSGLQNCERVDFCYLKPPRLWSFVGSPRKLIQG